MAEQTLRAVITAKDEASPVFRHVAETVGGVAHRIEGLNSRLEHAGQRFGALGGEFRSLRHSIAEFSEQTGLTGILEGAHKVGEAFGDIGREVAGLVGPLAGLGAAASVAGLLEVTKSTAEWGKQLYVGSRMTGIATDQLAGLHFAAKESGVDIERFDRGVTYLNRNLGQLQLGGKANKDMLRTFAAVGLRPVHGHVVDTTTAMMAFAATTKKLVDAGDIEKASALLSKAFGARSGMQLLPMMEQGAEKLKELLAEAKELGIALTPEQAKQANDFANAWEKLEFSLEGVKLALGSALWPVLQPIVQSMTDWLKDDATKDWLRQEITQIASAVRDIDWSGFKDDLEEIGHQMRWIFGDVLGLKGTLALVAAMSLAPLINAFISLAGAIAQAVAKLAILAAALPGVAGEAAAIGEGAAAVRGGAAVAGGRAALAGRGLALGGTAFLAGSAAAGIYLFREDFQRLADSFGRDHGHWENIGARRVWREGAAPGLPDKMPETGHWEHIGVRPVWRRDPTLEVGGGVFGRSESFRDAIGGSPGLDRQLPLDRPIGGRETVIEKSQATVVLDFKNVPRGVEPAITTQGNPDLHLRFGNLGEAFGSGDYR